MPSPNSRFNIRFNNVKTLGTVKYEVNNKVWLVSLDPKFGRPFITGKVIDGNDDKGYTLECGYAQGLSHKIPSATSTFLSEMIIVDDLTRNDERTITTSFTKLDCFACL
jgi:hypothetical protein